MFTPSTKVFRKCKVKDVVLLPRDPHSSYMHLKATVSCPAIEDGATPPLADNSNTLTSREGRAARNAVNQLAVKCAESICQNCVYRNAADRIDVADIRETEAAKAETAAAIALNIARTRLAARQAEAETRSIDDQFRGLL